MYKFPKKFYFGSVVSDFQHFGKSVSDLQERATPNHLKLYKRDFKLINDLCFNAFRSAVEWSRVEREKDKINKNWIEFYKEYFGMLKDGGIKTFVTLHHFTNPRWIHKEGGWLSLAVLKKFLNYVDLISAELKNLVDYYIVINEPTACAEQGYFFGIMPPNESDPRKMFLSLHNMILAIKQSSKIIRRNDPHAKVGFTHTFQYSIPYRCWHPIENLVDRIYKHRQLEVLEKLKNHIDFIGIDYYMKMPIKFSPNLREILGVYYPPGLRIMCKKLYERFKKPIIITENGFPSNKDEWKTSSLIAHLLEVWKSINLDGVNLEGYLWWCFLPSYEWCLGFDANFGLVDVNIRKNMKRKITGVALTYKRIIEENGISEEIKKKILQNIKFENWPAVKYKEMTVTK